MLETSRNLLLPFCAACLLTLAGVAMAIRLGRQRGWVEKPQAGRWHTGAPAKFGGVPMWLGVAAVSAGTIPLSNHPAWKLLGAASLMFVLGWIDDIVRLSPRQKIWAQLAIAAMSVALGSGLAIPGQPVLSVCVSLFWIVGITNAFNLLDNMDGLAAGVALIAAIYLAVLHSREGLQDYVGLLLVTAGAAAGFLVFNFNPARIFMGDAGSLFLGFLLGGASLLQVRRVSEIPALAFTPIIVLALPILDTFLVSVTRRLRGQPVSVGGTDHSSHRLVRMGLNERKAVFVLWGVTVVSGAMAIGVRYLSHVHALGVVSLWLFLLVLFGIHLFQAMPAGESTNQPNHAAPKPWQYDSLVFVLDPFVLSLSYYLAYFVRFEADVPHADFAMFLHSWPLVIAAKWAAMWMCRIYRNSWWRGSAADAYRLAAAGVMGEALAILLLASVYGFAGYSRIVFPVDFVIAWILLLVLRRSFQMFRGAMRYLRCNHCAAVRRVFVLGTSEAAELTLRFLLAQNIECAGLIDTNGSLDVHRRLWGIQVVGQVADVPRLAAAHHVSEVIVPENELMPRCETEFVHSCSRVHLSVMKLGLHELNRDRN